MISTISALESQRRPSPSTGVCGFLEQRMFIASVVGVLVAVAIPLALSLFGLRRRS